MDQYVKGTNQCHEKVRQQVSPEPTDKGNICTLRNSYFKALDCLDLASYDDLIPIAAEYLKLTKPANTPFKHLEERTRRWKNQVFELARDIDNRDILFNNQPEQYAAEYSEAEGELPELCAEITEMRNTLLQYFVPKAMKHLRELRSLERLFGPGLRTKAVYRPKSKRVKPKVVGRRDSAVVEQQMEVDGSEIEEKEETLCEDVSDKVEDWLQMPGEEPEQITDREVSESSEESEEE